MAITDPRQPDNPIVLANQAFLDLTGYTADEVVGRNCRFLQGDGTSPGAVANLRTAIAEGRDFTVELLNYRKDGSSFWNQLRISPIRDDDGELLYFFASQDDTTELRKVQRLEASEHRLLREVDHRARNVLAVVNGIVRLSRSDDAAVYAASIQQRVQALAAAHTLLAEGGWKDVRLEEVLRQQLDLLPPDRIVVQGPEVMVPASAVQPLALVIQELLINASVHGALSGPSGTLTVRWTPLEPDGGFELSWQEAGGPPPAQSHPPGFGITLVRSLIEKQLHGQLRHDWSQTGLTATISIPTGLDAVADALPR